MTRSEFLKGMAATGFFASGCVTSDFRLTAGGKMQGYGAPPLGRVRIGVVGLGCRGTAAVSRLSIVPGCEVVALCDLFPERAEIRRQVLERAGKRRPRTYSGAEGYKALCDSDLDLVYVTTPWKLHAPISLYAMRAGKHVATEVPGAMTVDDCWELVETSEKTLRHCVLLENCCYGEYELLALSLCRKGLLGELLHGEAAYVHDLRRYQFGDMKMDDPDVGYWDHWRLAYNREHAGNAYPTHGLGPVCQYLGVNRGDRFDYLVSMEGDSRGLQEYAESVLKDDPRWKGLSIAAGDLNTTLIHTVRGRTILLQHDVVNARPYTRLNAIAGTRGILQGYSGGEAKGYPLRVAFEKKVGAGAHRFDDREIETIRRDHAHPLWKQMGDMAAKAGGHGGMDFLMDLRLVYCLGNGIAPDIDVYDLAVWSSIVELTERSVKGRSAAVDCPDFTRGGWKTAATLGLATCDPAKIDWPGTGVSAKGQMDV